MKVFVEPKLLFEEISYTDVLLDSMTSGEDPWGDDLWD